MKGFVGENEPDQSIEYCGWHESEAHVTKVHSKPQKHKNLRYFEDLEKRQNLKLYLRISKDSKVKDE
jgi:hypothetical protein